MRPPLAAWLGCGATSRATDNTPLIKAGTIRPLSRRRQRVEKS